MKREYDTVKVWVPSKYRTGESTLVEGPTFLSSAVAEARKDLVKRVEQEISKSLRMGSVALKGA